MRETARNFSKRPRKVNSVIGDPTGSEFDCSDPEKSRCGPESSQVISDIRKALSAVTEELAALRKYLDVLKTQGYNPVSYAPNKYGCRLYLTEHKAVSTLF